MPQGVPLHLLEGMMSFTSCFLKWLTVTSKFFDVIVHPSSICIILIEGLMEHFGVSGTEQVVTQGCFELA